MLKPGGLAAVTVPRYWPERCAGALPTPYHEVEGGHAHLQGLEPPASWRRRAWRSPVPITPMPSIRRTGGSNVLWALIMTGNPLVKAYHKPLVWDMMSAPKLTSGWA